MVCAVGNRPEKHLSISLLYLALGISLQNKLFIAYSRYVLWWTYFGNHSRSNNPNRSNCAGIIIGDLLRTFATFSIP